MKKLIIILYIILAAALPAGAAQLDIGEDLDFEYRYLERASDVLTSEFRQRIKLYLTGYLQDDIEIGAKIQSSGIMNSTDTFVIYEGAKIDNLQPFFENAYIRIHNYYGYPVSFTFGKMPIKWVDGVLIDDNQLGLPAIMARYDGPYGIMVEGYHCRARNALLDISGIKGYGARAVKDLGFGNLEADYVTEKYESTAKVKRKIYGGNFRRTMTRGMEYDFFAFKMKGEKAKENFDGYALGAYGKFEGVVDPIGKGGAWIRYMLGTGDPADSERGFLPILSSVDYSIIGDYYGRSREHRLVDGSVSNTLTLSHSIANISLLRYAVYATVQDDLSVFMIRSTYKKEQPSLPLGGALTLGALYNYNLIDLEVRYTVFAPENAYDFYSGKNKTKFVTAEVKARF